MIQARWPQSVTKPYGSRGSDLNATKKSDTDRAAWDNPKVDGEMIGSYGTGGDLDNNMGYRPKGLTE